MDLPRQVKCRKENEEYEHFVHPRQARWEADDAHSLRSWRQQQNIEHGPTATDRDGARPSTEGE